MIAETFLDHSQQMVRLYCRWEEEVITRGSDLMSSRYCQNMDEAHAGVTEIGENHPLLVSCQKELGHQLPLSSYLLKPVQRLTKYQLLLKDLQSSGSYKLTTTSLLLITDTQQLGDDICRIN